MPSFTRLPVRGPIIGRYPLMLRPRAGLNGTDPLGQSVGPITTPEGRRGRGGRRFTASLYGQETRCGSRSFLHPTLMWPWSVTADTVAEPDTWLRNKSASQNGEWKEEGLNAGVLCARQMLVTSMVKLRPRGQQPNWIEKVREGWLEGGRCSPPANANDPWICKSFAR